MDIFIEEVESVITPLRSGGQDRNIEADMHFLKGSALNLGFDRLGALCSDSEKLAAAGQGRNVPIGEILLTYDASKTEFQDRVAG